jgi:hypothetical protein
MFRTNLRAILAVVTLALTALSARTAEPAAPAAAKGQWVPISEQVTSKLKCGYPGLTSGVAVDRTTGDVYMIICDQGLWKSTDKGATFARVDGNVIGGRCETGHALNVDPNGGRLMCFIIYGGCGSSADAGKTWHKWKDSHLDFGAVDWEATGKCFVAVRHESGGKTILSTDSGTSSKEIATGVQAVGIFDAQTIMISKKSGLERSTDGGATWAHVSDETPAGRAMVVFKGAGYWTTAKGLLVSKDKGATWAIQGTAVNASYGPYFGKDERQIVVAGKGGIQESTDAGATWQVAAPLPSGFADNPRNPGWFLNFAFDPVNNAFYASTMGKPTYKYER